MRRFPLILFLGVAVACAGKASKQFVALAATADLPANASIEIAAPEPLRTPAYHHQICFLPASPLRLADDPMGIIDAYGEPIMVQAAVSGTGVNLELPLLSYQGDRICFGVSDATLEQEFACVRLQASAAMRIERVEWQSRTNSHERLAA